MDWWPLRIGFDRFGGLQLLERLIELDNLILAFGEILGVERILLEEFDQTDHKLVDYVITVHAVDEHPLMEQETVKADLLERLKPKNKNNHFSAISTKI